MGLLTALACVLACITAFIMAWYLPVWPGDQALLAAIQQWQSPPLTATLETMTHLGWYPVTGTLALVAMTTLLLNKHAGDALLMAMAIASAPAIHPLKDLIGRPRPDQAIIDHVHLSMGFPSGHAACAMLLGGALIYLTWQYVREPRLRLTIIAGLATLILAVGISRIHLGLHWPSDLLGGYFYGASVILLAVQARVFWPQVRRRHRGSNNP